MNPSVEASTTRAAVHRYVDLLADEGYLPEAVVIAFKGTLAESESLQRFEGDVRDALRSALVSACIQRYFGTRVANGRTLRLVRDELEVPRRAASPDATA